MNLGCFQPEVYSLKCVEQEANNLKWRTVTTLIGISQKDEYRLHMVNQPVHKIIITSVEVLDFEQAEKPI